MPVSNLQSLIQSVHIMRKKRILSIFSVFAFVILAALGGWLAGSNIKSPAEQAAQTVPPKASPILVPIEERVISSDIVTRGTARFGLPQPVSIAPSTLKGNPGVITHLPTVNAQLNEGDVALIASGRPVFVLQGEIPAYRDLAPGMHGDDVRQLESALQRLGFDPGPVDGVYDEQTSTAVSDWYAANGFEPFGATPEQLANIRTLEQALAAAVNNKLAAEDAVAAAPLAIQSAQAEMWAGASANQGQIDNLTFQQDELWLEMYAATHPGEDQDPAAVPTIQAEIAAVEASLQVARSASGAAYTNGQAAVQTATDAQTAAERDLATAVTAINRITADLEQARLAANVKIPLDEIVFLPSLPVRADQTDVALGDTAAGRVMLVTNNQLAIDSSLPLDEAPLVQPGMPVAIDEPDLGISATGVVGRVADTPGTDGVDGFHIYLEVLVDSASPSLVGVSLRLTIPIESTGGKVTAVPVGALSLAADGSSRIQVDDNGALAYVTVKPGLSAGGYVEVAPVNDTLQPGQLVVIGFKQTP